MPGSKKSPTGEKRKRALAKELECFGTSYKFDDIIKKIKANFNFISKEINKKDKDFSDLFNTIMILHRPNGNKNTIFHILAFANEVNILKLFLELNSAKVMEIINQAKNSSGKTAREMAKGEFLKVVDDTREKEKNRLSSDAESNNIITLPNPPIMPPQVTNLARSKTSLNLSILGLNDGAEKAACELATDEGDKKLLAVAELEDLHSQLNESLSQFAPCKNFEEAHEECDITYSYTSCFIKLQSAMKNHAVNNIINITVDNLKLIIHELEGGSQKDEMERLLTEAVNVQDEGGNTASDVLKSRKNPSSRESKVLKLFNNLRGVMPIKRVKLVKVKGSNNQSYSSSKIAPSKSLSEENPEKRSNSNHGSDSDIGSDLPELNVKEDSGLENGNRNFSSTKNLSNTDLKAKLEEEIAEVAEIVSQVETLTKSKSHNNGSDSGRGSPELSKKSLESPTESSDEKTPPVVASRESKKEPKPAPRPSLKKETPIITQSDSESDSGIASDEETQKQVEEEKKKRENPTTDENNNHTKSKDTQPHDRKSYVKIAAFIAVGCFVAGVIMQSKEFYAIGVVCAIATVITWCLTPSSELTSMSLKRNEQQKPPEAHLNLSF